MAITLVQYTSSSTDSSPYPATFTNPTTAGNCIVMAGWYSSESTSLIPEITNVILGSSADNFTQIAYNYILANNSYIAVSIWVDPGCAGSETTVTASGTNLSNYKEEAGITICEVSGLATSNVTDKYSTNTETATTFSSGTTATTSSADEFWIGVATAGSDITQTGSWNSILAQSFSQVGYQIVSSTGTAEYSGTASFSAASVAAVATLLPFIPSLPVNGKIISQAVKRAAYY